MKTKTKDLEMETCPREGVVKEEKLPHNRKYSHRLSVGSCGVSASNITEKKKENPQNTRLTTTPSNKVAQMLLSASSEWELNREVWVACFG